MRFVVIDRGRNHNHESGVLILEYDNWDDYGFKTTFHAYYKGEHLGLVKIGYRNMSEGEKTFDYLQKEFDQLPEKFFSIWQSEDSYETISAIEDNEEETIFKPLRDIAYDLSIFDEFKNEPSLQISLLRSVSAFACRGQFHRIAIGGSKLIEYHFEYKITPATERSDGVAIRFDVNPSDYPPSNIHALIGRNGIGKTQLIQDFVCSICGQNGQERKLSFMMPQPLEGQADESSFANVICVAFSPFDDYERILELAEHNNAIANSHSTLFCSYIGLDRKKPDLLATIEESFIDSYKECIINPIRDERLRTAIGILSSDPAFSSACKELVDDDPHLRDFLSGRIENVRVF